MHSRSSSTYAKPVGVCLRQAPPINPEPLARWPRAATFPIGEGAESSCNYVFDDAQLRIHLAHLLIGRNDIRLGRVQSSIGGYELAVGFSELGLHVGKLLIRQAQLGVCSR